MDFSGLPPLPMDKPPAQNNVKYAISGQNAKRRIQTVVALRSDDQAPIIIPNVYIEPYLVERTYPYLCLAIFEEGSGQTLGRSTSIPLATLDWLCAESGELGTVPGVVETWPTFPFESDRNDRNTYVFSIETKGFRGSKLEWYGERYEDMNAHSRRLIDLLSGDRPNAELNVLMTAENKTLFESVTLTLFEDICNEITRLKAPDMAVTDGAPSKTITKKARKAIDETAKEKAAKD